MRGRETECAMHSVVLKPPMEPHANRFGREGGTCLLMEIEPERLQSLAVSSDIASEPSLVTNTRLAGLGHHVYREFVDEDALSALAIEALILELLVEASRTKLRAAPRGAPSWLRQVHELLHDRYREALTLTSVAREVNIHPSRLAAVFRRHYRSSLGDYVRRLRIERASVELASADTSIAEISHRLGFFDQAHFSRVFRQYTGRTPTEFRTASRTRDSGTKPVGAS